MNIRGFTQRTQVLEIKVQCTIYFVEHCTPNAGLVGSAEDLLNSPALRFRRLPART